MFQSSCVSVEDLMFFQVRDDNKRQHPCLVEFSKLPEQERSYNLQMSLETLKYVCPSSTTSKTNMFMEEFTTV